jgi:hypothetical protein
MIRDLDDTIQALLKTQAPVGSELAGADITFDLPDGDWRTTLLKITVNCYLYDIRENRELRTHEPLMVRSADGKRAMRRSPPVRVDCAYCITGWSPAASESVLEEHRLLSQVLTVLLRNPTIPTAALKGSLVTQIPPYPTMIAVPDGVKNPPEFWGALDQQLKPSLNYVVTLAYDLEPAVAEAAMPPVVTTIAIVPANMEEHP